MRKPDRPGTYRVVPRGGEWMLSGVRLNGTRLKIPHLGRVEAERMGAEIFGRGAPATPVLPRNPPVETGPIPPAEVDAWGLPIRLKAETKADLNASLGFTPVTPNQPKPETIEDIQKKETRKARAKSLMDLAALGYSLVPVAAGRKLCDARDLQAVEPNKEHLRELREVTRETLTEWFGDKEVEPWKMMILLSVGIPISMWIQSPKKKKTADDRGSLRSVP